MRSVLKSAALSILIVAFLFQTQGTAIAVEFNNPLIEPYEIVENTEVSDHFINILLLGIDFGTDGYWGSGWKKEIDECHTDAVMVVAINLDKERIDLISLPRDTVTYVQGVKGIYKLNAAVNCAQTLEDGLQKTKYAAERLLGGVRIDYYFAVDMNTMIALGDTIGGVDMELEMSYKGHSGQLYQAGMQHLDGTGITDYLRARTNATVNYTDIGRTNRQRQMMLAIFEKLRNDEDMIWDLFDTAITMYDGFFTDITTAVVVQLAFMLPTILNVDAETIGSHVLAGPYLSTLDWNFTYTDQDNRLSVLEEVYGIAAEPIPYVSSQYMQWLLDTGFTSVHYISLAQRLMDYSSDIGVNTLTDEQSEAYHDFELAYQEAAAAFDVAADSMAEEDTQRMEAAREALREAADACAIAVDYSDDLPWFHNRAYWWDDPYVNENQQVDWR